MQFKVFTIRGWRRWQRRTLVFVLTLTFVLGIAAPANAASDNSTAQQAPAPQLDALLQTIEDDAKRAEFIKNLKALIAADKTLGADGEAPPGADPQVANFLDRRIGALGKELLEMADSLRQLPQLLASISERLSDKELMSGWLRLLGKLLLTLAGAWVLDRLVRRALKGTREGLESRTVTEFSVRVLYLLARTALEVIPIAVFGLAAYFVMPLLEPGREARGVTLAVVDAVVVYRALMAVARMLFTPAAAQLRLFPLSDISANYWFIWSRRLVSISVYGYFFTVILLILGLPNGPHAVISKLLALAVTGMLVVLVLQNRAAMAGWLNRPATDMPLTEGEQAIPDTPAAASASSAHRGLRLIRKRLARSWHILVIVYFGAIYSVWALGIPGGFEYLLQASALSLLIFTVAAGLAGGLGRAIDRRFAIPDRLMRQYPLLEARANRYLPVLKRVVNGGIWGLAAISLLQVWGLKMVDLLSSTGGQRVLTSTITIIVISLAALLIWEVVSYLIERAIERTQDLTDADQNARIMTLLPLARRTFLLVIVVMVILMVLSEFGINIAPLLAGAGVIGLAIGFGAQTLVKDVINGLFILIENTIAVGDWVDVGGPSGTVESLSIRSVRLRDSAANVYTVPFSDVSSVINYTRDYSYAVLNIGVAYRENVDDVMEVIAEIGEEMLANPDLAADILEPMQVQGVNSLEDSAVVIRARIKVRPGNQWAMRRHFNRLLKNRFDELGIEIPFPHQTVYFGVDAEGQAPPAQVLVRHSRDAAMQPEPLKPPPKRKPKATRDSGDSGQRNTDQDIDQGGGVD